MSFTFVTHPSCALHEARPGHPESPARLAAVESGLRAAGLLDDARLVESPAATREQLLRVHSACHVQRIHSSAPASGLFDLDPDTTMNSHSLSAALHAAGATVLAGSLVADGSARIVFCNLRPPGHHAERARPMGFCLFNSIAVGVADALETQKLDRVAVVDFDVHHGNGTEDIFADDHRVLMCSTYQYPLYPDIRARNDGQRMINVELPPGSGGDRMRDAVNTFWRPALDRFCPQAIFVSAGFDAHKLDPLAGLTWNEDDFAWLGAFLANVAERHCAGRLVAALEGGYHLTALAASATSFVAGMLD